MTDPATASAAGESCRKLVDSLSGERYFARISRTSADGSDIHNQGFRIEVTDCSNAWIADVQKPPPDAVGVVEGWMAIAQQALAPHLFPRTDGPSKFSFCLARDQCGDLKIQWAWGTYNIKASVVAVRQSSESGRCLVSGLMDTLVDRNGALQKENAAMAEAFGRLRKEAEQATCDLEGAQAEKQHLEEQLCAKFAALLNEKKRHCKMLREQVAALQQQLDETAATNSSESDSGRSEEDEGAVEDMEQEGLEVESEAGKRTPLGGSPPRSQSIYSKGGSVLTEECRGAAPAADATPASKRLRPDVQQLPGKEASPQRSLKDADNGDAEAALRQRWGGEDLGAATVPLETANGEPGLATSPVDETEGCGEVQLKARPRRSKRPK